MIQRWTKYLFGFRQPVTRLPYLLIGFGLAALKFAGDTVILRLIGRPAWTPSEFLSPFYSLRFRDVIEFESLAILALWALPLPKAVPKVPVTAPEGACHRSRRCLSPLQIMSCARGSRVPQALGASGDGYESRR